MESEHRMVWLGQMLMVRDLEILNCSIYEKLRTESAREQGLDREVMRELMYMKQLDEKRNYRELKKSEKLSETG